MEAYELDQDKIISWAINFASYDELESVAKSLYSVYVSRRKKEMPKQHIKAKEYRKKYNRRRKQK